MIKKVTIFSLFCVLSLLSMDRFKNSAGTPKNSPKQNRLKVSLGSPKILSPKSSTSNCQQDKASITSLEQLNNEITRARDAKRLDTNPCSKK